MLNHGEILADGTLNQLLDKFGEGDLIEYVIKDANPSTEARSLSGVLSSNWNSETGQGLLTVKSISETLPAFLDLIKNLSLKLTSIECRRSTLDDLFLSMSGRHLDE
jgi:ABC-2 type transport system ATP-binding protein